MPDIIQDDARIFEEVETLARSLFRLFEFREIRTPVVESTEVFTRSIGEGTDIVEKEMYTFLDRGGKNISLRPEGTASVMRAYIEHGWANTGDITKLFYIGSMFRGERPQKGRLREFHQIGAEIIGGKGPYLDAEIISVFEALLKKFGVTDYKILINSLGCAADRDNYKNILKEFLLKNKLELCEDCARRVDTNVLRVLDCKRETCRDIVKNAPSILASLCEICLKDFNTLKTLLSRAGSPFKEEPRIVRGLDYYTGVIFEVIHPGLGSQDALGAGGRYDNLSEQMSGPKTGATGFALGIERLLLILNRDNMPKNNQGVLVAGLDESSVEEAFILTQKLRGMGITADMEYSSRSLKGALRKANREGRNSVVLIGENELKAGKFLLKNMKTSTQELVTFEELAGKL
ncbi:Histidyl-tRNA synthetase [Candidatus Omnitrophus magneticus]|uniref:Histidine--tRNA ligase n=1 Tax=Candidatus Omnitrophus magneticus TaxID=1609969 RepID=A0A0F0CT83_9BACT|nr:Histidyl-tRNA synthetase [Candidatus Omnitrophus magneticus]